MIEVQGLIAQQKEKAKEVSTDDMVKFNEGSLLLAGADVGFEEKGTITRAAVVILHYPSLTIKEFRIARIKTTLPYIPGLLSFRELPALMAAWKGLSVKPDLVFVDGHGRSHPRHFGIASHFGLEVDIPTIGVAKKCLFGQAEPLNDTVGSCQPLMDKNEQIGWVWRSKARCRPLYISVGHKVSLSSALYWVQQCTKGYRLPEPTRLADMIASNRTGFAQIRNLLQIDTNFNK